jgi:hypothetical protein
MSTEPFTITVTYLNGTTSTFRGCTGLSETETKLKFHGTKEGGKEGDWTIVLSNVLEFSVG